MSETGPSIGMPLSVVESLEAVEQSESSSFIGFILVERLVEEGVINGSVWFEPSEADKDRTVAIVNEVMSEANKSLVEPVEIHEDVKAIEQKGKEVLACYIADLSSRGVVSDNIIALTNRITRVADIKVLPEGGGGINYDTRSDSGRFGDEEGNNFVEISVSQGVFGNRMAYYGEILNGLGAEIDQETLLEMALGSVIGHEWSHSVQRAIDTDLSLKLKSDERYDEARDDDLSVSRMSRTLLFRAAAETVSEVEVIAGLELADQEEVDRERFATGFEWDAAISILRIKGVSDEIIDGFRQKIIDDATGRLDGVRNFSNHLKNLGIDLNNVPVACLNARKVLREYGISIPDVTPRLWSDVGYETGYTTDELREILRLGEQEANRADLFDQVIEMRREEADY